MSGFCVFGLEAVGSGSSAAWRNGPLLFFLKGVQPMLETMTCKIILACLARPKMGVSYFYMTVNFCCLTSGSKNFYEINLSLRRAADLVINSTILKTYLSKALLIPYSIHQWKLGNHVMSSCIKSACRTPINDASQRIFRSELTQKTEWVWEPTRWVSADTHTVL